jgi:hypothetical protein
VSDEFYTCGEAFGAVAAALALWFQFRRSRQLKKVLKMLEKDGIVVENGELVRRDDRAPKIEGEPPATHPVEPKPPDSVGP